MDTGLLGRMLVRVCPKLVEPTNGWFQAPFSPKGTLKRLQVSHGAFLGTALRKARRVQELDLEVGTSLLQSREIGLMWLLRVFGAFLLGC